MSPASLSSLTLSPGRHPLAPLAAPCQQKDSTTQGGHLRDEEVSIRAAKRRRVSCASVLDNVGEQSQPKINQETFIDPHLLSAPVLGASTCSTAPSRTIQQDQGQHQIFDEGEGDVGNSLELSSLVTGAEATTRIPGRSNTTGPQLSSPVVRRNKDDTGRRKIVRGRRSSERPAPILSLSALVDAVRAATKKSDFQPKPWQIEGAYRALAGWDGIIAAGTGAGKSAIWLLIILAGRAPVLVITALKAIQKEQIKKLAKMGISAVALNGDTMSADRRVVGGKGNSTARTSNPLQQIEQGLVRVVFAAPETLITNARASKAVCDSDWAKTLGTIIVDEAHVVYDWGIVTGRGGSAFRPEFGKLAILRARFHAGVPLIAVSATLCGPCLPALCTALRFGQLPFFALDVGKERDGCIYDIQAFRHAVSTFRDLLEVLPAHPQSLNDLPKVLIYVDSRTKAVDAADAIRARLPAFLRHAVESFTAGDTPLQKNSVMRRLRAGKVRIVAATEVLGMGIDLPDVDMVIQFQMPKDFKSLVQHFGRAARGPNAQAKVLLLCDPWICQVRESIRQRGTASACAVEMSATNRQKWEALDEPLRKWLECRGCLRTELSRLLGLDFSVLPGTSDGQPATVSSEPIGRGPVSGSSADRQARFYWRATPSTLTSTSLVCCSNCDTANAVERHHIEPEATRGVNRLTAPPLNAESVNLRRELAARLNKWRTQAYNARPDSRRWQNERSIMSDEAMRGLTDRAPRILAHVKNGGKINSEYVQQLLGASSSIQAHHLVEVQDVLQCWANASLHSAVASRLTPAGWIARRS
ncbi:hypothetical protein A4X13_0g3581 [Tilletia indica]|uniref:DNA 3'-5' helicase n=1 Tax=Tilletia indica TaxID=43049 RepID=A0A177TGQ8_9BASI|nr:hypothetical protein A4X13_0g3581 [Tilletia indica]